MEGQPNRAVSRDNHDGQRGGANGPRERPGGRRLDPTAPDGIVHVADGRSIDELSFTGYRRKSVDDL